MPVKIIQGNFSVTVVRDGKSVNVKHNVPFEFSPDEIDDIVRVHGQDGLRDPKDETKVEAKVEAAKAEQPKAAGKKSAAKNAEGTQDL